jgi:hypothetical protein
VVDSMEADFTAAVDSMAEALAAGTWAAVATDKS